MKAAAVDTVNAHFNTLALNNVHRDAAHAQKREWARGDTSKLAGEATLRGTTADTLAAIILAKPDNVGEREHLRQLSLLQVEAAKTPADLDAAVKQLANQLLRVLRNPN